MSLNDIGHVNSRVQTDLATNEIFGDTETDLNVVSTSRFQAPCAVLIGHRDAWHDPTVAYVPEIIWVTEVPSGTVLRTTLANRGQSGTAVRTHDNSVGNLVATLIFDQRNWELLADALAARSLFASGTYTGDDTDARKILLDFTPRYVEVVNRNTGRRHWSHLPGSDLGHYLDGVTTSGGQTYYDVVQVVSNNVFRPAIVTNGFTVSRGTQTGSLNYSANTYDWVAWG